MTRLSCPAVDDAVTWHHCPYCRRDLASRTARATDTGWACPSRHAASCARLEDVRWMLATGETLPGAAARLRLSDETLSRWLWRNAPDLVKGTSFGHSVRNRRSAA